jgi:hypothetical protein
MQFSMIGFSGLLSQTLTDGLGNNERGCPTMRQFSDLPAPFAISVVTRILYID